ncbi:ATP-binding protein [Erythrobacter dokdonensis]|uniref:histidine kinase n=1 Tax=Erythrobacter dokdonensis DSW-74 TaxID=1300349 RepID=A0A1A7BBW5_9SPHN|nr:ATP-binding protein [Erythrobacter dokdonensis]OBV09989.1 C4-dicarboxylate transport sensor protein [Erythrobacter dokdonensis DSW-74]
MQGRLGRWHLVPIALAALLLLGALAMLGLDRAMRVRALEETRTAATSQAAILAAGLESELNKFSLVPRVLAVDPEVAALLGGESAQRPLLNRRLAALAQQTSAAAIYLMDARGTTLAASNWDRPDSFIGSNYRFREYFNGARKDGAASEFALGTVSRRPGLYLAERVGPADQPLGVVAVKVEFDSLEAKWRDAEDGVFVTDAGGIVLLASNPEWRFRSAAGERPAQRDPARDAMRFGVAEPLPFELPATGPAASRVRMIEKIQPIAPVGWELHLLADPAPRLSVALANGRLAGVIALALLALAGAGALVWRRQRQARAAAEIAAQTATLREQLQQANRLATLGQITAGLGHEIRQPLAAMRVYAENGERLLDADRTDEAAENFHRIAGLAGRIGEITEEQLNFSRRSAEEPRIIALAEVIDGSLLLLRDQIRQKGLSITWPDPRSAAAARVRARHVQLEQVLVNLLQNAVQAAGQGGEIALAIAARENSLQLSVTDNGPGVLPELQDSLFQPFVTSKREGIGLGLAIARDIMRELGGDLTHEATATGARFTMTMPAA